MTSNVVDVTGLCLKSLHGRCSGKLLAASGSHWWCACSCHPERTPLDASVLAHPKDVERALATWRAARDRFAAAGGLA